MDNIELLLTNLFLERPLQVKKPQCHIINIYVLGDQNKSYMW